MKLLLLFFILSDVCFNSNAQTITEVTSGTNTSVRGLSVVDDNIIWASGSNGFVAKSIDGGKSFSWKQVKDFEQRDFRDIEAFDANNAVIMAVAEPAIILKTTDGGINWNVVFKDTAKGMFLDAMDFDKTGNGVVVGDPINGNLFFAETKNFGTRWSKSIGVSVNDGEALFASSGTNIHIINMTKKFKNVFYVTGGKRSRLFFDQSPIELKMMQGSETQGANSVAVNSKNNKIVVVGGDFSNDTLAGNNCELFSFKNNNMLYTLPKTPPHGYRSCVIYLDDNRLLTCGTSGVDISNDGGINWKLISKYSYHVCSKAKKGNAIFLAGSNGRIAKFSFN